MAPASLDPVDFFHAQFADAPLRALSRGIISGYETAEAYFRDNGFTDAQRHDCIAGLRRAHIERNTLAVLSRFPSVTVTTHLNEAGNASHNRIDSGLAFLTISAVSSPKEMVRDAAFRQQYAFDQRLDLFKERCDPKPGSRLYGIVVHGPAERPKDQEAIDDARKQGLRFDRPAFICIVCPDEKFERYLTDPINLLTRFRDLLGGDGESGNTGVPRVPLLPVKITGAE